MDTDKVTSGYEDKLRLVGLIKEQFNIPFTKGVMIFKELPEVEYDVIELMIAPK